jgi:fructokinase
VKSFAADASVAEVDLADVLAGWRRPRGRAHLFDVYAFADYRGGQVDGPGVVLCVALGGGPARRVAGVRNRATLDVAWRRLLRDATDAGARVCFGQDHQYGLPVALAEELGLPTGDWREGLAAFFHGARGEAARAGRAGACARLVNGDLAARARRPYFWSATKPAYGLPRTSPRGSDPALYRLAERGCACALSRVGDNGSVGGQTLVGLPRVLALLAWAAQDAVPVAAWPFDGLRLERYGPRQHVALEAYPSLVRPEGVKQSDLADALAVVRWLQRVDRAGALAAALDLSALSPADRRRVAFEGWIAGVRPAAAGGAAPAPRRAARGRDGRRRRALDVLCLGEALVDLLPDRRGALADCDRFEAHSGGAPANVAVGLARLGRRVAFQGVVGDDPFGEKLARKLAAEGIEVHLRRDAAARTGLAFIALDARGDRSFFSPAREHSADKRLVRADVDPALIARARWLHAGLFAHLLPEARDALRAALAAARASGTRVSFDPNVRLYLWDDAADLGRFCGEVLPRCDLVKLSEDECEVATGERDPERALERLEALGVAIGCVTLGERGALLRHRGSVLRAPAGAVDVVDTTGAGDGFVAGLLAALAEVEDVRRVAPALLERALAQGCRVAARVCARLGAVAGLPRAADLEPAAGEAAR